MTAQHSAPGGLRWMLLLAVAPKGLHHWVGMLRTPNLMHQGKPASGCVMQTRTAEASCGRRLTTAHPHTPSSCDSRTESRLA